MKRRVNLNILLIFCLALLLALQPLQSTLAADYRDMLKECTDEELAMLRDAVEAEWNSRGLGDASPEVKRSGDEREETVWVSKSGKKYHSTSTCSNMKKPIRLTLDDAVAGGYTPCKKCH